MIILEMPLGKPTGVLDDANPKKHKHGDTLLSLASLSIDYNSWFDLVDNFSSCDNEEVFDNYP